MENLYIANNELKDILSREEKVYVFGTGVDAEQMCNMVDIDNKIIAFIDNKRNGYDNWFRNKKIISVEQFLCQKKKIIIAAGRFCEEIRLQLENLGLKASTDFFIWDEWMLYHSNDSVDNYICFLENLWKPYKKSNKYNKVLVAFDNRCDLVATKYAYCANYFANKYDALIYGYFRFGSHVSNASPIVKKIYQAINMVDLVDSSIIDENEVMFIVKDLWKNLRTWGDWKSIKIYGIQFGTTIIRDFLRTHIPDFDLRSSYMYDFLVKSVKTIVFWKQYFKENNIKVVLLGDGVSWDGYIRDIAVDLQIPAYSIDRCEIKKMTSNYFDYSYCFYYKDMWNLLKPTEKFIGIEWAKEHIKKRIQGDVSEVALSDKKNFAFAEKINKKPILNNNNKIKILICPHIFEEDCYHCGEQIFDDNYFEWLCHLGELSEKITKYDWYLKMHPSASKRDYIIINKILKKYPRIQRISEHISPIQLRDEGIKYALTVCGSIGHEYPMLGIEVINAGKNLHQNYDFNWNPKDKKEYDDIIYNLENLEKKKDKEGLYEFYAMHFLIYDIKKFNIDELFFKKSYLNLTRCELSSIGMSAGVWMYDEYIKNWDRNFHESIMKKLDFFFQELDKWKPDILYRSKEFRQLCELKSSEAII